jgi:hypothetical protein
MVWSGAWVWILGNLGGILVYGMRYLAYKLGLCVISMYISDSRSLKLSSPEL